jgi:cytochrome P450
MYSYAKSMLENREKFSDLDDIEFNSLPGTIFNAGVDTTSSTLQSFVLAMVLHPEAQTRAQAEIDMVIGPERSPVWEDEARLPYVQVSDIARSINLANSSWLWVIGADQRSGK